MLIKICRILSKIFSGTDDQWHVNWLFILDARLAVSVTNVPECSTDNSYQMRYVIYIVSLFIQVEFKGYIHLVWIIDWYINKYNITFAICNNTLILTII